MSNYCGECRFFNGSRCSTNNNSVNSTSGACSSGFSAYGRDTINEVKRCGDCRFFTGNKCSVNNNSVTNTRGACAYNKATCK